MNNLTINGNKAVEVLDGYFITNMGKLYSNIKMGWQGGKENKLHRVFGAIYKNGYRCHLIRGKKYYTHTLVLEAFVGKCPKGKECCHINDIKTDNRIENLYWGTRFQNKKDSMRNGTVPAGEKHFKAKLTEEQVKDIYKSSRAWGMRKILSKRYGVVPATVGDIWYGRNWKTVTHGLSRQEV